MITSILAVLLRIIQIILFAELMLTWFPMDGSGRFVRFIRMCTAPILMPFRALLGNINFLSKIPFNFSYIIVFALLEVIIRFIA